MIKGENQNELFDKNRILLTYMTNGMIYIHLNDYFNKATVNLSVNLSNTLLVVGSSLLDKEPIEHLDGKIEMLGTAQYNWNSAITEINNILQGEQQLSVKTEVDLLGRLKNEIIDTGLPKVDYQNNIKLYTDYEYMPILSSIDNESNTSMQVSRVVGYDGYTKEYEYDDFGNITKIKIINQETSVLETQYEYQYDSLSRLIKETNPILNKTIKYTYGLNNNLINKKSYEINSTNLIEEIIYQYDSIYQDKLISIITTKNGIQTTKTIEYNSKHQPINYLEEEFEWEGSKLKSININNQNKTLVSYEYNDQGIRTSKIVQDLKTTYDLIKAEVAVMTRGNDILIFHYNERRKLVGFEYKNENYFYNRDLTGAITTIVDKHGVIVVKYEYDAWGKWINKNVAALTPIGHEIVNLNPYIYKGYIYDEESGMYYLQSRYYSPELGRFISPDSIRYLDTDNIGLNLYCYCNNNPVMYLDSTGHSWESFWGGVGNWFQDHWVELAIGAAFIVGGAIVTALTAGAGVVFVAAFGSALLSSTIQVGISMGTSVLVGGVMSMVNGGGFFDNIGDSLASGFMWGGIFAGGAQIIGGGFRMAANMGAQTGRNGGIALGKTGIKALSPDANTWTKAGGTLLKIGKNTRLDIGAHWGLHIHTALNSAKWLPSIIKHFPIGAIIAGFID